MASTTRLAGSVRAGAVVSRTVTVNDPVEVFVCASAAEQSTDVGPKPKVAPLGGTHVTATVPSTTSAALVVKGTGAPDGPVASAVNEAGSVRVGAVVSLTVTLNWDALELPCASVAVQLTGVVASRAKVLPDGGTQSTLTRPSTRSTAVGLV